MTRSRVKNDFSAGIDDSATSTKVTVTNSGVAGTLTTAAQPNITSVGTLTGFTSTGIDDNASGATAITIDSSENVTVTPSGGVITLGASGQITSKQSLDVATAGGRYIGSSNRGIVGQIRIEQTATGADGGYIEFDTCASGSTSPIKRIRVDTDGLKFGNDTAAANALDDYEEGTWTPSATQGGTINTVDAGNCTYTKIGNTVHIRAEFYNFSSTNSSALIIGGLPHAVASGPESAFPVMYYQVNLDSGYTQLTGYVQSNSSNLRFYESGDAVNWSALRGNQCGSSTDFIFSATYQAA